MFGGRGKARAPRRRKAFSPPGVPTFPPPGVPGRTHQTPRAVRPVRPRARDGFAAGDSGLWRAVGRG
eukprot:2482665-Alexandrium_andersonii.AAC.1